MPEMTRAARQFLADARRLEARATTVTPGHAGELRQRAATLREAAARIQARARQERGDELALD